MEERDLDTVSGLSEQPMVVVSFPGRSEGLWSHINLLTADLSELESFDLQTIRTWLEYGLTRLNDAEWEKHQGAVSTNRGPRRSGRPYYQGYRRLPASDDD